MRGGISVGGAQRARQQKGLFHSVAEYCDHWEITPQRLALAKKNALVMHPGPMNRGVEIAASVADWRPVGHHSAG